MAELLKEAIADAKAVREVALQNAKMALEEAFDSKIKNMLSAKLAEELEEDVELEEVYEEDDTDVTSEGDDTYEEDDVTEEFDIDEEINLDELMAELESLEESDDEEALEERRRKRSEDDEEEEKLDEETINEIGPDASEIATMIATTLGVGTVAFNAAGGLPKLKSLLSKAGSGPLAKAKAVREFLGLMGGVSSDSISQAAASGVEPDGISEGEFDIDALISEIEAELEEGKKKKEKETEEDDKDEKLKEALATVEHLQETISEMNLLNSKLLYCNKLFRANALTEAQKVKVVDALDKAATTGEAKLVYETLQESFAFTGVEKRAIQEGLGRASKAAGTAPKKVITESVDETVSRFQKLANINK